LLDIEKYIKVSKEYIYLKISEEKISITNNYKDGVYNKKLFETRISEDVVYLIEENNKIFKKCLPKKFTELGK
jgi:hypothetical protein